MQGDEPFFEDDSDAPNFPRSALVRAAVGHLTTCTVCSYSLCVRASDGEIGLGTIGIIAVVGTVTTMCFAGPEIGLGFHANKAMSITALFIAMSTIVSATFGMILLVGKLID